MARLTLLVVVSSLAVACAQGVAQQPAPATPFAPFSFLAGSCWKGTFPDGKVTDEHCFEWVYGGKFLRDNHVVEGARAPYSGETMYAWDPKAGHVVYWYVSSDGAFSTGHAEYRDQAIVFPETHTSAAGTRELENVWRRTGADAYRVEVLEKTEAGVKPLWTMELQRTTRKPGT